MNARPSFFRRAAEILGVAAAYYAAGRAGLLLAIPPGYATAVWPPSGIALAAFLLLGGRTWPGVWIGSFLVNLSASLDASSAEALRRSILLAATIGAGAALQAGAGAFLVRRFVGTDEALREEGRIIRLLLLGGPVGCVVNATWGVSALWTMGLVAAGAFASNWLTWWVGDAIGVMIFTPLILLCVASPRSFGWKRQAMVAAPLAVTFAVVVALFIHSSRSEAARIRRGFDRRADKLAESLQGRIDDYVGALGSVQAFFAGSQSVERKEFGAFTSLLLKRHPDFRAMSWNVVVPGRRRAAYEAGLRAEGFRGSILEKDAAGEMVPAGVRDSYVAVTYIEPREENRRAIGFDVASDPLRREGMEKARRTGLPAATAPVDLIQSEEKAEGVLIYAPIFSPDAGKALLGYTAGVFEIHGLVESCLSKRQVEDIAVALYDDGVAGAHGPVWGWSPSSAVFQKDVTVDMAGRPWRIRFSASPAYLVGNRSEQSWWLLAGGLLFTGVLGALLLVITGRTARVEEEVFRRTAELRAANRDLDRFFTLSLDMVCTADFDGRFRRLNPSWEKVLGYSRVELLSKPFIEFVHPDDRGKTAVEMDRIALGGESMSFENRYLCKGGGWRHLLWTAAASTKDGVIYAIARDVTDWRARQSETERLLKEVNEANRELSDFAHIVSHDLKAPLRGIASLGQWLMQDEGERLSPKGEGHITMLLGRVRRMGDLIDGILRYSRVGREKEETEDVDLKALVPAIVDLLAPPPQVTVTVAEDLPVVRGERVRLQQVFQNLIGNAIKYMDKPAGQVRVSCAEAGGFWRFTVSDNGPGIESRHFERIFQIFQTLAPRDQRESTGVGLAIVKKVIQGAGGRVWVESVPGKGSAFCFTWPAGAAAALEAVRA